MPDPDATAPVVRVLIAPASELARSWFAGFPRQTDHLSIVGIVPLDDDLPAQVQELAPDVVVLDAPNPGAEGIAQFLDSVADPAVDILVIQNGETTRVGQPEWIEAGVRAILSHHPTLDELETVIRAVRAGFLVVDPHSLDAIAPNGTSALPAMTTQGSIATTPLTPREVDVLNGLAEGLGNKQIAVRLGISEHTVKTHLAAIFEKLDASNRTEAVMAGARLGLVLL
jgi:two-component system, NarL family, response regulator YdfI